MNLIQMRYFFEVCRWQNITKAAETLHVSQPTVSVAMQTLEAETGLNLFRAMVKRFLYQVFTKHGFKPNVIHYSPYLHTVRNLVRKKIASSFLMRHAILPDDDRKIDYFCEILKM